MAKNKSETKEQSFEQSLEELETIVLGMENDQLPLEQLIAKYERGAELLAKCESTLASAKKKLETIAKKQSNAEQSTNTPSSSDDDEIRLF